MKSIKESQNSYYNYNSNYLNSYIFIPNSNNDFLILSRPVSNESRQSEYTVKTYLNNNTDNFQTREISNNNNGLNKELINMNNENINTFNNIFNNIHPEIFISKKRGRPRRGQENKNNRSHTNTSYDNARKKIINSCKSSIYNLIEQYISKETDIKLHIPTIKNQMGNSYESINKFFDKKIYDIFCDTIPKKLKDEIKNNREQYQHNTYAINMLLENELKDGNKQIKILNRLFNLCFKDYLIAYLNNKKEIKISDDINISLNGFKTFDSCFNEIFKEINTQDLKEKYKTKILDMLDSK